MIPQRDSIIFGPIPDNSWIHKGPIEDYFQDVIHSLEEQGLLGEPEPESPPAGDK